mmetsp:Transcript_12872/g.12490  ORF Transcript_12872/g.12490 Transcript_12872/m.12490 type:complete len:93 (-) Transcript_12872:602-880(-)
MNMNMMADSFGTTSSLDMTEEDAQTPSSSSNPVTPDSDDDASLINTNGNTSSAAAASIPKRVTSKDVVFGELHSEEYFHHTYQNTLPATLEK